MLAKPNLAWLLLLVRLPATHSAERVAIWRKLKKSGAIQIQTSTYVLPDDPRRYEIFQWLTQHIRDAGGDATLVRAREIEGLPNERLVELFNAARAKEYAALREILRPLVVTTKQRRDLRGKLDRIRKQFREIRETDFFNNPKARDLRDHFRETGRRSAQVEDTTEARAARFSPQSLAYSAAARDRSCRFGMADQQIHRSESEIRFREQTWSEPTRAHFRHAGGRFLS